MATSPTPVYKMESHAGYKNAIKYTNSALSTLRGTKLQDPLRVLNGALENYSKAKISLAMLERTMPTNLNETQAEAYKNLKTSMELAEKTIRGYARLVMQQSTEGAERYAGGLKKQVEYEEAGRKSFKIGGTVGVGKLHLFKTKQAVIKLPSGKPSAVAIGRAIDDAKRYLDGQQLYTARVGGYLKSAGILTDDDKRYIGELGDRYQKVNESIAEQARRHGENVRTTTIKAGEKADAKKAEDEQARLRELDKRYMEIVKEHGKDIRKKKWY